MFVSALKTEKNLLFYWEREKVNRYRSKNAQNSSSISGLNWKERKGNLVESKNGRSMINGLL